MKKLNKSTIAVLLASFVVALALPLIVSPDSVTVKAQGVSTKKKSLSVLSMPAPAGQTIDIKLKAKRFIPEQATMKDGDTIRICNNDPFYHSPFSYSKHNKFGSPKGIRIRAGECITRTIQNPTTETISVKIFDELHASEKLTLTVLPAGKSGGLSGSWRIVQTADNGRRYTGTLRIKQSGYYLSGRAEWDNHTQGNVSGAVQGRTVKFTVQYEGGLVGSYEAEVSSGGNQMLNGEARSNKGGGVVKWQASRARE